MSKTQYFALAILLMAQMVIGFYLSSAANKEEAANTPSIQDNISSIPEGKNNTTTNKKQERVLRVGDNIIYRVVEDRDDEKVLPITETGEIIIPYCGPVMASGKTAKELTQDIQKMLEETLYEKATVLLSVQIAPTVLSMGTVYLGGRVNHIGAVQVDPTKKNTVAKIILSAGGFSEFADAADVHVVRKIVETDTIKTFHVDVASVIEDGKLDLDFEVIDGDFIIVPKRLFNW